MVLEIAMKNWALFSLYDPGLLHLLHPVDYSSTSPLIMCLERSHLQHTPWCPKEFHNTPQLVVIKQWVIN